MVKSALQAYQPVTILALGLTGAGKSESGNAFLQMKDAFKASSDPKSHTNETTAKGNKINGVMRYYIDTPGLDSTYGNDQQIKIDLVKYVNEHNNKHGINAFFLTINIGDQRFTPTIKNLIITLNDFFIDSKCWNQAGIIFTKCDYNSRDIEDNIEAAKKYREEVIKFIKTLPRCQNIDIELPCFFVNSKYWETDVKTQEEYDKIFKFAQGFSPVPHNFQIPALSRKDSYDPIMVHDYIDKVREPNQKEITMFAFGKNRHFNLDKNGKIIIPIKISLSQLYEYRLNWESVENVGIDYYPASASYNFEKMQVYPTVEGQTLVTFIDHRIRWYWYTFWDKRRKTSRYSQELIIELGGGFVFKGTNNSKYVLRSPNVQQIYSINPNWDDYEHRERVDVPKSLDITMN